ncbi:LlaJI family restriction endonuclease [Bacillus alveayuensis]|uniref:LlaJI family restriction endonuclease n=1 Tax=Aeribacillus alveayuensis TaxID=279215 RepID=UPI0005CD9CF4|nr:LlaJI family restriction endonuclease [Bacillus alveayuensis]
MNNLYFFSEHEYKTNKYVKIPSVFYERGLCDKVRNELVRFKITGIIEYQENLFVILPKGMDIPSNDYEKKRAARLIYKVLNKYSKTNLLDEEENDWLGDKETTKVFELVQWLVEDYRQNGLIYMQRRIEQINGNGRINWSKTLAKMSPILIKNKLFYIDLITSKNDIANDHELTLIHAFVLKEIKERFGWLFNFSFEFYIDNVPYSIKYMQYRLQQALRTTYVDREITLFKKILSYLDTKSRHRSSDNLNIYATPFFHNVWESICSEILGDMEELHSIVPNPYWMFKGNKLKTSQIPDILIQTGESIFIFDAKYYRIKAGLDKLPGWGDIVKQLFYALSMKNKFNQLFNVFLFPDTCNNGFEYLGYASVEGMEDEFGKVLAFGIDIGTAMKFYVKELDNQKRIEFVDKIINKTKEIQLQFSS